ncbi:hypothetical protein [uncultured Campylobacter sp.]|uniref:hypothetical protein n=1 Tax=uncultured Campylobacter sp. TaxID=218934 RepID=UPI002625187B|nr:hypothetical protein [uncultured Campylobacter sp.]
MPAADCEVKFKKRGSHKAMNLNLTLRLRDKILKSAPQLSCLNATEKQRGFARGF